MAGRGFVYGLILVVAQTITVALTDEDIREDICFGGVIAAVPLALALLGVALLYWDEGSVRWVRDPGVSLLNSGVGIREATDGLIAPLMLRAGCFFIPMVVSSIVLVKIFGV